jgi:hypothetical protein
MAFSHRIALLVFVTVLAVGCENGDGGSDDRQSGNQTNPAPADPQVPPQPRSPMPAPPRTEVVGAFWEGKVVVLSGLHQDDSPSNQVDFYDPASDTWTTGPPLPMALHHAGIGVLDGRLYVVGGYASSPNGWMPVAEVRSLGADETRWRDEPSLAGPRGALAVASTGDALVAVGGTGNGDLRRTEILASGATEWQTGPDLRVRREHLAATAVGSRVYAIGGRAGTLESNRRSVESFAVGEDSWRAEADLNEARGGIGAATVGDTACVAGGEAPGGRTVGPVECLTDDGWQQVGTLENPRHGVAVISSGRGLHVIGGGPQPGLFVSDTHEYFDF